MAAPTNAANVKKVLANPEPSTHGTKRTCESHRSMSAFGGKADIAYCTANSAFDPKRTFRAYYRAVLFGKSAKAVAANNNKIDL
jgi:hypothetical protein